VATKKQVEAKLRELIRRLEDAGGSAQGQLAEALPNARVIQIEVPDLDARYWTELAHGRLGTLRTGASDGWDMRVTADADDLIAMIDGNRNLLTSYLTGRIRMQASATDLMALRKLM
jgi:predicted lipid carrier protein YhbT